MVVRFGQAHSMTLARHSTAADPRSPLPRLAFYLDNVLTGGDIADNVTLFNRLTFIPNFHLLFCAAQGMLHGLLPNAREDVMRRTWPNARLSL